MVEKQLEQFPCLTARFYRHYDTSTVGLYKPSQNAAPLCVVPLSPTAPDMRCLAGVGCPVPHYVPTPHYAPNVPLCL